LSRQDLIKELRKKNPKLNKDDFENIIDSFCSGLEKALKDGKNIELRGFGTFFVKRISEKYSARNPKTGKLIYVPEKNKIRFKVSKKLKELINK
tara:strand:+ start:277 stop:558 length:282 start_codon:yes stop_codon:yes gene_type:complete